MLHLLIKTCWVDSTLGSRDCTVRLNAYTFHVVPAQIMLLLEWGGIKANHFCKYLMKIKVNYKSLMMKISWIYILYNFCHHYADLYFVKGVPPNSQNLEKRTALHLSVINRNIETVRALLKVGASVNIQVRL